MKLKVVRIVRDPSDCVACNCNCVISNDQHPDLIPHVEDDCNSFVVAPSGFFWPASEFLMLNEIRSLDVNHEELVPLGRSLQHWDTDVNPPEPGNLYPKS